MYRALVASLGLVALSLWAPPSMAAMANSNDKPRTPPLVSDPIPIENRAAIWQTLAGGNYKGTLSGTLIEQSQATTAWFMYPGACADRQNGLPGTMGTWAPRSTPQADSLDTYLPGTTGPYDVVDLSFNEPLWHITDGTPVGQAPTVINGTNMIWCGKYDPNWVDKVGYPNLTYQILYLDTGSHGADYHLTFKHNFSSESRYDFIALIGGGHSGLPDQRDPVGNSRSQLDNIIASGSGAQGEALLVQWSGIITAGSTASTTSAPVVVLGAAAGFPATVASDFVVDQRHRALYLVFQADCLVSSEDGLWPEGNGQQIDDIATSDNGALYTDEIAAGGVDAFSGNVLKGSPSAPIVSARVPPGVGENWHLEAGNLLPTPDVCTPKHGAGDLIFVAGNFVHQTIKNEFESIVSCSFPIPVGTASVLARWDMYVDLPQFQGYVAYSEFRIFKDGSWGNWNGTGAGIVAAARQAWLVERGADLAEATQADSVQIRHNIQCVPPLAADQENCGSVIYGALYDNFRLEILTGVPAPVLTGVSIAQSTFVDGTIAGTNCAAPTVAAGQCWPGLRGSDNGKLAGIDAAIHDNFNGLNDWIGLLVRTGLRKNGKGINWHHGFDLTVNNGLTVAHTNPNFVAAYDSPRIIYRIFDPANKIWSPFDSSELDAAGVSVQAGDTTIVGSGFVANWPFRDKAGTPYPGGFTLNGSGNYPPLHPSGTGGRFLPRGSRIQYYFKGVDINGGISYQFSPDALAREVEDLPTLPCHPDPCAGTIVAPDIVEFDVLPRVYGPGGAGTLLDGRTNTPILDLDGSYTRWNFQTHATTQILRALGVRADRYRRLYRGAGEGIGGHELAGTRVTSLTNYFPNMEEYGIKDALAGWYRIMIESSHIATLEQHEESDAKLIREWWDEPTGSDGGDRCIFASGDDYFNRLLAASSVPHPNEGNLATQVFGIASATNQWIGGGSTQFPVIQDLFADPVAGPALGSGAFQYVVDGGCPIPNRFDALTKNPTFEARNVALYPRVGSVTDVAAVSYMSERDIPDDHDRNKSLGYGFSVQFIRQGGSNLVDTRAQVLYKFLTSCRGPRTASDTASCWPCPTEPNKYSNWATAAGFQIGTYGPLYPIQDGTTVLTSVDTPERGSPPFANALSQNRPNPFNPETAIPYSLETAGRVAMRVYDVAGRLVRTLVNEVKPAGSYSARWDGRTDQGDRAANGVYFYRITYPDGSVSAKKLAILR